MNKLSDYLNEGKTIKVKRKYLESSEISVGQNGPLRDKILSFISEKGSVTKNQLVEFLADGEENVLEYKSKVNNWINKNERYITKAVRKLINEDGESVAELCFKVSKLGKKVLTKIN